MKNILIGTFLLINYLGFSQRLNRYSHTLVEDTWVNSERIVVLKSTKKPVTGIVFCEFGDMATIKNGKPISDCKKYYRTGETHKILYQTGETKEWYKNGQLKMIKYQTGEGKIWFESGKIKSEELINGDFKTWDENGILLSERVNGLCKSWNYDGIKTEETQYQNFNNKWLKDGVSTEYFPNGNIKSQGNFIKGSQEGVFKEWDESGKIVKTYTYKNDQWNGPAKGYYDFDYKMIIEERGGGKFIFNYFEHNYINGDRFGTQKEYYDINHLAMETYYENDKPNGKHKEWFENGVLGVEGQYVDGLQDGTWKFWNSDGSFSKYRLYDNGEILREYL